MKNMRLIIFILMNVVFFSPKVFSFTKTELFKQLYENNLMLKEERLNLKSIEASSATLLAAPELAISEMNSSIPFLSSSMKMQRSIEISQMLPNPLKVAADKNLKNSLFKVQGDQVNLTFKRIKAEAFNLFLGIYQNQKELEIYSFKKNQLEKFLERLNASQVQGQEDRIQIAEVKSDLVELKLNLKLNQTEYFRMKNMLNQMLNLELDTNLSDPVLDEIILDRKIKLDANSDLMILASKIDVMESDLSMKKSEFYPEFSLKVRFNKSYSPLIENSKEVMMGITLPFLFLGQQTNGVEVTRYKLEAMKHAKDNQQSVLKSKAATLFSELEDLILLLKYLKESSLVVKEQKMKLFSKYSYTDMKSLMNYKMSFDEIFMIKMKILEKEIQLQKKYFEWMELEG